MKIKVVAKATVKLITFFSFLNECLHRTFYEIRFITRNIQIIQVYYKV